MNGIFITGTDTGIGKTYVARLFINALNALGVATAGMKPVASGAQRVDGELRNEDALQLQACASLRCDYHEVNPYVFEAPVAPHIAAAHAGTRIDIARVKSLCQQLAARAECVVVEGVGAWQVPLDEHCTVADLAYQLGLPVVMVVGMRLGCLNHALLTAGAIDRCGAQLLGWVANSVTPDFAFLEENVAALRKRISAPLIATLDYDPELQFNNKIGEIIRPQILQRIIAT
ncbi:MAG: dethiobiotin synthase [Pseudomonadota bacterium]|nr:MAG: dethiobiotin synthase [Pseudomonadota bacterium]